MSQFDFTKCYARLTKQPNRQCKNNQKIGNLCGIHADKQNLLLITDNNINVVNDTNIVNDMANLNLTPIRRHINTDIYTPFSSKIVKIQALVRGVIVRLNIKRRGIATYCKHLITNDTDFLSFEDLTDITTNNFFSYKDTSNRWWGFNVATFKELIKNSNINPYNTCEIDNNIINNFNILLKKIEKNKKIEIINEIITDPEIILQQRCVSIFQKMDNLKQYTKCEWFLSLNVHLLKQLYKFMEDMWNYRIGLSPQNKLRYVNNGKLFTENINNIWRINDRIKLSNILLNDFDRMVTEGITDADKSTASLWILSGLTLVNMDARNAMPWLYESAANI